MDNLTQCPECQELNTMTTNEALTSIQAIHNCNEKRALEILDFYLESKKIIIKN